MTTTFVVPESMQPAFERSEHPYHMWDALVSTPEALELVLAPSSMRAIQRAAHAIQETRFTHFIGCGTSYFNALASSYAFNMIAGRPAAAADAFEFLAYPPPDLTGSAVVGISHSGETAATVDAIAAARRHGAVTVGYTDHEQAPLAQIADITIYSPNPEKQGPKTRSYAASLLRSYLLAAELVAGGGRQGPFGEILSKAPEQARHVLESHRAEMEQLAQEYRHFSRIVVIGGGPQVATAGEAALKFIETALINADSWEIEEAVHGTWVCLKEGDLVIVIGTQGPSLEKARVLVKGLKTIGVTIWGITDVAGSLQGADHETLLSARVPEWAVALFTILPLYQFIYFYTLAQPGLHPDRAPYVDPRYIKARTIIRKSTKRGATLDGTLV